MTLVGDQLDRKRPAHYDKFKIKMHFWRDDNDAYGAVAVPVFSSAGDELGILRPAAEVPAALKQALLPYYQAVVAQLEAEGLTQLPPESEA